MGEVWADMPSELTEVLEPSGRPTFPSIEVTPEDLEPHKSSCNLLSAAMAAACIGLSAALILFSPPTCLGPDGKRVSRRALFSAAAKQTVGVYGTQPSPRKTKSLPGSSYSFSHHFLTFLQKHTDCITPQQKRLF